MLSKLGLGLPKSVLEGPQLFVVKAIDIQHGLERYYQRHYVNMDRQEFDSWLLSMVPSNVETRTKLPFQSYHQKTVSISSSSCKAIEAMLRKREF